MVLISIIKFIANSIVVIDGFATKVQQLLVVKGECLFRSKATYRGVLRGDTRTRIIYTLNVQQNRSNVTRWRVGEMQKQRR
jgi:hypothetical protein